jgi:hypothetical protein
MLKAAWDWLVANKEWFFSGAGLTGLAAVLWFWKRLVSLASWVFRRRQPVQNTQANPVASGGTSLDAVMIKTQILFIDDDVKFKVVSILQTAGWQNTRIVKDIASLDEDIVKRAHILFVDINGVGKKLGFKDEGLGLALALKTRFPFKRVIIYSADTKAERFHDAWKRADDYLAKNADPYQFQQIVEDYAGQLSE